MYGDPTSPATSIVFGEKGAGKTAMRLQMAAQIEDHNAKNGNGRLFVIEYDDFNPFLDRFADRLSGRKRRNPAKVLAEWKLWDHMDAILSLGVTSLVDRLLGVAAAQRPGGQHAAGRRGQAARPPSEARPAAAGRLLRQLAHRDVSVALDRLRRKLGYWPWQSWAIRLLGVAVTAAVGGRHSLQQEVGRGSRRSGRG